MVQYKEAVQHDFCAPEDFHPARGESPMAANGSEKAGNAAMESDVNAFAEKPAFIKKRFTAMSGYLREKQHGKMIF